MKRCGKLYHLNYQIVFCKMLFSAAGFLFKKGGAGAKKKISTFDFCLIKRLISAILFSIAEPDSVG